MTPDISTLPDFPALQQLARAMWRIGSTRGAAVMIGAGFTRNVDRPGDDSKKPPLWNSLRDDLINELYHENPSSAPANPLRIAEEYRTTYGQAALDSFIRARFPDRAWLPGHLHLELLNLQWSEVLTTNWDTVLERTAEKVTLYNYEVVRSEADLTYARSPRIVKLHGTFGDKDPLVFAEEDYRLYPSQHAAFVNFARQVFIENELCLLGFSGDDPNFLQWAGWVRDQLGGKARRIYLVGYLNLSPATRRYFEARNIAPVDFAPIITEGSGDERHAEAARLFFAALRAAKPAPRHIWNLTRHDASPVGRDGLDGSERIRKDAAYAAAVLDELTVLLRQDRLSYPGWLVCPRAYRRSLRYVGAEQWVWRKEVLTTFKPQRRAEILYELVWRRTIGFDPLDAPLEHAVAELLGGDPVDVPHHLLAELGLAMMRNARLSDDQDAMTLWGQYVEKHTRADDPLRLWVKYQHGLRARDVLDFKALAEHADNLVSDAPDWRMRRAALLAEAGHFARAIELYREAERDLDARARNDRNSLWIKSRQGWVEWLSRAIDLSKFQPRDDGDRERFFRESKIDPGDEIDEIRQAAEAEARKMRKEAGSIEPLFQAGRYRDGGDPATGDGILYWYEADQLLEAAGIPVSIGHVNLCGHMVLRSADASYRPEYFWYTWLLRGLHSHFDDAFKDYFGRLMIARLPEDQARRLIDAVNQAFEYWRERFVSARLPHDRDDFGRALDALRLYIMALAHLTPRMSIAEAKDAYRRGVALAREPEVRHHWIAEAIGSLLTYAAESVPYDERTELAFDAAQFPLASEKGLKDNFLWPKAAISIWGTKIAREDNLKWRNRVEELLQAARSSTSREAAILMLMVLDEGGGLLEHERAAFGEALWSQVDESSNPLPINSGLLDSSYIDLPAPPDIDVQARVRARVVDANIAEIIAAPKPSGSQDLELRQNQLAALRLKGVVTLLNPDRAVQLFDQLVTWEPISSPRRDSFSTSMVRNYNDALRRRIGEVLGSVAVPAMRFSDCTPVRCQHFIDFILRHRVWDGLPGLTYFAAADRTVEPNVVTVIRRCIWGGDGRQVANAAYAVSVWAKNAAERSSNRQIPRALIDALLSAIEARPEQGLETLLQAAKGLLVRGFLDEADMNRLAIALEPLLAELQYGDVTPRSMRSVSISLERSQCVELAKELRKHIGPQDVLQAWLTEGAADPLPEVRFAARGADASVETP